MAVIIVEAPAQIAAFADALILGPGTVVMVTVAVDEQEFEVPVTV